jgi:hypothetical protein
MHQIKKVTILVWVIMVTAAVVPPASACTLWSANGRVVDHGGSIIVKNRDWAPDHRQELKYVVPEAGYTYIGIFAADGASPGLKAGLNEKGLVVVSASASSIPMRERRLMPGTHKLLHKLLTSCSSVDDALGDASLLLGPRFLMLADKSKVASVEIGPGGVLSIQVEEHGFLYHTNHYVDDAMDQYNRKVGESSKVRYERISELLSGTTQPYDLDTFISFSHDRRDGDDNSIFRVGSTVKKPRTLAVWAVSLPENRVPELYVEIINPGEPGQKFRFEPFPRNETLNKALDIPASSTMQTE